MDYEEVIRRQSAMHVDKDGMLKERAKAMRELLDERGQAISGQTGDYDLIPYLYAMKFDTSRACDLYAKHYEFRLENFDSVEPITKKEIRHVLDAGVFHTRRDLVTKDGQRIIVVMLRGLDWDSFDTEEFGKAFYYTFGGLARDPITCERGLTVVINGKGVGMSQLNFAAVRLISESLSSRLPIRIAHIYIVHEPWFFNQVWSIMKLFLKEKLQRRMNICGNNLKPLLEDINPALLPPELGGTGPEFSAAPMVDFLSARARE